MRFYPLVFTGKERDEETGYGYFGARYMDHELTAMWISVDPMADKYPSISPYAYCAWNPVKLVDPDGREAITNDDGWLVNHENKTITHISDKGGSQTQYATSTNGFTLSYDMNIGNFIKSRQADGYKIKEASSSKTGVGIAGGSVTLSILQNKIISPAAKAFREQQQLSDNMNLGLDYSKELSKINMINNYVTKGGRFLNLAGFSLSTYQLINDNNVDDAVFHSMDVIMGVLGAVAPHPVVKGICIGWAFCGRSLIKAQAKSFKVQMDMGLNPGSISLSPFK